MKRINVPPLFGNKSISQQRFPWPLAKTYFCNVASASLACVDCLPRQIIKNSLDDVQQQEGRESRRNADEMGVTFSHRLEMDYHPPGNLYDLSDGL